MEDDDAWEFDVPVFDSLQPEQKIAALNDVATSLLNEDAPAPRRTAVLEGTLAVIYGEIGTVVAAEIAEEECAGRPLRTMRGRLRDCCEGFQNLDLPAIHSADIRKWVLAIRILQERILWDQSFRQADLWLDADPACVRAARNELGLEEDYFTAVASDPKGDEVVRIRKSLRSLTETPAARDALDTSREVSL